MQSKFEIFLNLLSKEQIGNDKIKYYLENSNLSDSEIEKVVIKLTNNNKYNKLNVLTNLFPIEKQDIVLYVYLKNMNNEITDLRNNILNIYNYNKDIFYKVSNLVLNNLDSRLIYEFARFISLNDNNNINKDYEDAIIKTNDLSIIVDYASNIKTTDIKRIEKIIVNSNNPRSIFRFAMIDNNDIDINKLEDAIIKTNNIDYITRFANYVKNANIDKLEQYIINTNDINVINNFSIINKANIKMINDNLVKKVKDKSINKEDYLKWELSDNKIAFDIVSNFINKYFQYDIKSIKEGMDLIDNNLYTIIDNIGLVHFYNEINKLSLYNKRFNFKENILNSLITIYPNKDEILEVYYNFLTSNMDNLDALKLDNEYFNLLLKNNNKKIKL